MDPTGRCLRGPLGGRFSGRGRRRSRWLHRRDLRGTLFRAGTKNPRHPRFLRRGDRQRVFVLHTDLGGDVLAAEPFIRRQPFGGISVALGTIGRGRRSHQVQRVVGQGLPLLLGELLPTGNPSVFQRDHMVDIHGAGFDLPVDRASCIGVVQASGSHLAVLAVLIFHP